MSMNDSAKEIGIKLRKIRKTLKLPNSQMAYRLGIGRGTYNRNEEGKSMPGVATLIKLAGAWNISLQWLLLNKGSMYYREEAPVEEIKEEKPPEPHPAIKLLESLGSESEELLEHMDRIPLLRHKVMVLFHTFKEDRKEEK
ncbi:MAG: helix-turn-helix transcriptional regulator [bacterium]|nr:helix-turn-helix transcriptional regulator [bacterium]